MTQVVLPTRMKFSFCASLWTLRPAGSHWSLRLAWSLGEQEHRRPPGQARAGRATRLGRYPLLVIDEVGYIPFEPEAANLFFQLVSSRYERARLIVTSSKPFGKAHLFARTCVRKRRNSTGSRMLGGCGGRRIRHR
jgi:DNA replication protein DnaC